MSSSSSSNRRRRSGNRLGHVENTCVSKKSSNDDDQRTLRLLFMGHVRSRAAATARVLSAVFYMQTRHETRSRARPPAHQKVINSTHSQGVHSEIEFSRDSRHMVCLLEWIFKSRFVSFFNSFELQCPFLFCLLSLLFMDRVSPFPNPTFTVCHSSFLFLPRHQFHRLCTSPGHARRRKRGAER